MTLTSQRGKPRGVTPDINNFNYHKTVQIICKAKSKSDNSEVVPNMKNNHREQITGSSLCMDHTNEGTIKFNYI